MPLTEKGQKIMSDMKSKYGEKEGERVFYASKNAGKISGVDDDAHVTSHPGKDIKPDDFQHMGFTSQHVEPIKKLVSECDTLSRRLDAFEGRQHQRKPVEVKPRVKDQMQPSNRHPKEVKNI